MFGWGRKDRVSGRTPSEAPDDPLYVPGPRALASASYVEIADRTKALDGPLQATAYVFGDRVVVSRLIGRGPTLEIDEPLVLPLDAPNADLGRAICDQLLAFRRGPLPDLRDRKVSDWAAWRVAGATFSRQFQGKGYRIALDTEGDGVLMEIGPMTTLHANLSVLARSRPDHGDVGEAFHRGLRGAMALREAGVV